jgi:hypothetical protein
MNTEDFVSELSKLRPSATFLSIIGYTASGSGEVADHSIVFHISYENALRKSVAVLDEYVPENDLEIQAKNELLLSFHKSLGDMETTAVEDIDDGYQRFFEGGTVVKGVKLHKDTNTLHIWGMANKKVVRTPGTYKPVKSSALTLTKNKLRNLCSVSKFRQFKITPDQVDAIKVENLTLTAEGLV